MSNQKHNQHQTISEHKEQGSNYFDKIDHSINKQDEQHKKNMQSIIKPVELKTFKAYPFVITVMVVLQMMSIIYGRKFVSVFGMDVFISSLIFVPLILYVFQVVAECYGWQYCRQIVWCSVPQLSCDEDGG
jgi:hypothetical protein